MLPARFKVRNYCSIAWNEPLPGGKIASGASVVRVRSSQIVEKATFSFTKNVEDELMKLRKFLDVDMLLVYDGEKEVEDLNHFCFRQGIGLLANTVLNLSELIEEVKECDFGTGDRNLILCKETELQSLDNINNKAELMSELYQLSASYLFDYEEPYPLWVKYLNKEEERYMAQKLVGNEKNIIMAYVLLLFGFHYAYLKRPWLTVLYIGTIGGCFLWFLLDIFRMPYLIDMYYSRIANSAYRNVSK